MKKSGIWAAVTCLNCYQRLTQFGFDCRTFKEIGVSFTGNINYLQPQSFDSEHSSVTVIKDTAERYFLSFVVEVSPEITPAGIALGIKVFGTLSTGERVVSPSYSKLDRFH